MRCKRYAETYLEYINLYYRQVLIDLNLPNSSQQKLKELLIDFINQLEDYLRRLETNTNNHKKATFIEELNSLTDYFNNLANTTPKLKEIKKRVEAKMKYYDSLKDTKHKILIKDNENEQWIDNLLVGISKKNEKLKEFEKHSKTKSINHNTENSALYLTMIQKEFTELRDTLAELKKEHTHPELDKRLEVLNTESVKIETDNKLIQREHAELVRNMRILCIFILNGSTEGGFVREGE